MKHILISPHADDAVLFASFLCLRYKPLVVRVFDGYTQGNRGLPITAEERAAEDDAALGTLGCSVLSLGLRDDRFYSADYMQRALHAVIEFPENYHLIVPAHEWDGHDQHNQVAAAFGEARDATKYLTYTTRGKSTSRNEVEFEPYWIGLKLRALASYRSQWHPAAGCAEHFIGRSLREYVL